METSELLDLTNPINLTTPLPDDIPPLPMHRDIPYSEIGTPCCFLTGQAGTGKSYTLQRHIDAFPNFATLTCSTGVAAINLSDSAVTINSKLGFFNIETLQQNFNDGYLEDRIRRIKLQEQVLWLVMDEVSMSMGRALDIIYTALDNVNAETPDKPPLGFMLTGDPLQLAPVPEDKVINGKLVISPKTHRAEKMPIDWPYTAKCWPKFAANTIHLTKVHRQSDPTFLNALNHLRSGNGMAAASLLKMAGVRFFDSPEEAALQGETGTIIVGTNKMVDKINLEMLEKEEGESFTVESKRWFARQKPPKEWEHVPDFMELKIGSLVMVLTNDAPVFSYVNGDLGRVTGVYGERVSVDAEGEETRTLVKIDIDKVGGLGLDSIIVGIEVELLRNGNKVVIPKITRTIWQVGQPDDWELVKNKNRVKEGRVKGVRRKVWILGELTHFPIRLAYASTVNKTQGLTLPKIQIRLNDWFIGSPQFLYVAVSRCTTAEGIQIIGSPNKFARMVKVHDQVRRFI